MSFSKFAPEEEEDFFASFARARSNVPSVPIPPVIDSPRIDAGNNKISNFSDHKEMDPPLTVSQSDVLKSPVRTRSHGSLFSFLESMNMLEAASTVTSTEMSATSIDAVDASRASTSIPEANDVDRVYAIKSLDLIHEVCKEIQESGGERDVDKGRDNSDKEEDSDDDEDSEEDEVDATGDPLLNEARDDLETGGATGTKERSNKTACAGKNCKCAGSKSSKNFVPLFASECRKQSGPNVRPSDEALRESVWKQTILEFAEVS